MPVRDSTTRGIHSPNAKTRTGLINPRERYRRCSLPDRISLSGQNDPRCTGSGVRSSSYNQRVTSE